MQHRYYATSCQYPYVTLRQTVAQLVNTLTSHVCPRESVAQVANRSCKCRPRRFTLDPQGCFFHFRPCTPWCAPVLGAFSQLV